jgi:hypothetical protein
MIEIWGAGRNENRTSGIVWCRCSNFDINALAVRQGYDIARVRASGIVNWHLGCRKSVAETNHGSQNTSRVAEGRVS